MIVSFECDVSDKLKVALENYVHPRNELLGATDGLFVENRVLYYGRMVLIVQTSFFDVVAEYLAYMGLLSLLISWLVGSLQLWSGLFYIGVFIVLIALCYLSSKVRFYLLRWRVNRVVDKNLKLTWLSKEQVITRFIHGAKDGAD